MRTVTFADPTLIDYLKNHFVLVWHNQSPGPSADPASAAEQGSAYEEGSGGGNIRTYFCTADGQVCFYLQGYWSAARYGAQARAGYDLTVKAAALPRPDRQQMAGKALTQLLWDLSAERRRLRAQHGDALTRKTSSVARDDARLALLERTVTTSADLFGDAVAPILADLEAKNRRLDFG